MNIEELKAEREELEQIIAEGGTLRWDRILKYQRLPDLIKEEERRLRRSGTTQSRIRHRGRES